MSAVRVLIVDDSESDRALVTRVLSQAEEEYEVVEAASRPQLEEKLAVGEFDLVVSDYNILGLDGLEVLEAVQNRRPETPVILLTGTGNEEVAVAALKRGAADYVVKSVQHIKKLPATVGAVLERVALAREREGLANALRFSEEKYRLLVENAAEAVVSADGDDLVSFFSRGAERMFGCSGDDVMARPVTALVPAAARSAFARQVARYLAWGKTNADGGILATPMVRHDGEEFPAELSLSPLGRDAAFGYTAVIRDVTEKKRMEVEISRLDRLAAVGEMTAGIAHEVRNPLAAITTSATVAKQDLASAGLETESAEWILEGARKIEGLLKRFFDFAKPLEPERKPCRVETLLRDVVEEERPGLEASHVAVDLWFPRDLPSVSLDPGLMKSVFTNVVVNARQVMPRGGNLKVRAKFDAEKREVVVVIADTGPGLSLEEAVRALEPFSTTKADGVGLGLPLCLKIVKAHGGDFALKGREIGAEVTVTLPVGES